MSGQFNLHSDSGNPLHTNSNASGQNLVVDLGDGAHYSLGATQVLTISATAAQSNAIGSSGVAQVRVIGSGAFHLAVGTAPTAAATADPLFPANVSEVINVPGGQKVSIVQDGSATGSVYVTVLSYP